MTPSTQTRSAPTQTRSAPTQTPAAPIQGVLAIPPSWVRNAVRFVVAEQYLGGPLVGLITLVVSGAAALAPEAVLGFFYCGAAADLAMWALIAAALRVVWVLGWCGY